MAFLFVIQSNENDTFGPNDANVVLWLHLKIMQRSCNQRKTKQSNTTIDADTDDEVSKFDVHSVCSCRFCIGFCVFVLAIVLQTQSNRHHVALPSVGRSLWSSTIFTLPLPLRSFYEDSRVRSQLVPYIYILLCGLLSYLENLSQNLQFLIKIMP